MMLICQPSMLSGQMMPQVYHWNAMNVPKVISSLATYSAPNQTIVTNTMPP